VVLAALVVVFLKVRQKDLIGAMMEKRRAAAKLVSRAEYVEGPDKIPVALALTEDTFYYENPDLEASFELNRLDEVEYSDELSTGRAVHDGCSVLRLRSHGTTFEFVLEKADCAKWKAAFPPHTYGNQPTAEAM
jgi:hypothetical protein